MNYPLRLLALGCLVCASQAADPADGGRERQYLGKSIAHLTFHDFKVLPAERRNQIVREIAEAGPLGGYALDLLRDLCSQSLLTEPSVIPALVEVLERSVPRPGTELTVPQANHLATALQILQQVSRREIGVAVRDGREKRPEKIQEVVAWWSDWWKKNRDKHPMFDAALDAQIKARVVSIEKQLLADLVDDYQELRHLDPKGVRVFGKEPQVNIEILSALLAQGVWRRDASGKEHMADAEEHTYTRIQVTFATPPLAGERVGGAALPGIPPAAEIQQVYKEEIPGTDLVITVAAAQKKGDYIRRVKESLAKLPPREGSSRLSPAMP